MVKAGYIDSGNAFGKCCNMLCFRQLSILTEINIENSCRFKQKGLSLRYNNKQTNKQTNTVMKDSRSYTAFMIAVTMLFAVLTVITAMPMIMHITTGAGDVRSCLLLLIPSAMFAAIVREFVMYLIKN